MAKFTTDLILKPLDDGKHWRLMQTFTYQSGPLTITVPKKFTTDFASVPRFFWRILPPWGKYGKAAVLHDYLYHTQKFSRKRSDKIFLEAMRALGVKWWKRKLMYRAVRVGGWLAWRKNKTR